MNLLIVICVAVAVYSIFTSIRVMMMCDRFIKYLNSATEADQYMIKAIQEAEREVKQNGD